MGKPEVCRLELRDVCEMGARPVPWEGVAGSRSQRDTNTHGTDKGKNHWNMWRGEEAEKMDPRIWGQF